MKGLRLRQIMEKTGLKKPTIYSYMKQGKFPRPGKIGKVSVWDESEIDGFLEQIMSARKALISGVKGGK